MIKISIHDVKTKNRIYQFRVDINGAKPPIWRWMGAYYKVRKNNK